MALQMKLKKKFKNLTFESGKFYQFLYNNYQNDPTPFILFLNCIEGVNPKTNHRWDLIQGINLHYLPISVRERFAKKWITLLDAKNGNVIVTWKIIKSQFPFIQFGIRRYLLKPTTRIQKQMEVGRDNLFDEIKGSLWKDFSGRLVRKQPRYIKI